MVRKGIQDAGQRKVESDRIALSSSVYFNFLIKLEALALRTAFERLGRISTIRQRSSAEGILGLARHSIS